VTDEPAPAPTPEAAPTPYRRRPRYAGKYPRRFEEKYKEHSPERYAETVAKVLSAGKTPAGTHRSIMVAEVLSVLAPQAGEIGVDCTLGYGGHAQELLAHLQPGGRLLGLDADPIVLPKTEARLRALGFGPDTFTVHRSNFAGLPQVLVAAGLSGVDFILADLGVSSMQLDDPSRGFSLKREGPLDMRMNPRRGRPASALLERTGANALATLLAENADEPNARPLADALAGHHFATTTALAAAIRTTLPRLRPDERGVLCPPRLPGSPHCGKRRVLGARYAPPPSPGLPEPRRTGRSADIPFGGRNRRVKKAFGGRLAPRRPMRISPREVIRPAAEKSAPTHAPRRRNCVGHGRRATRV